MTQSQGHRPAGTAGDRCPACGGRVRPDDEWCSLCHRELGAPPATGDDSLFGLDAVGLEPAPAGAAGPPAPADVDDLAARMLAELAAAESARLPGPLAALRHARAGGQRAIAAAGGAILLALIMAGLALTGVLL